jgi:hypothetical protein
VSASPFGSLPVAVSDTEPPSFTVYGPPPSTVGAAFSRRPTMIGSWSDDAELVGLPERLLSRRLERRVVVHDVGLVRVDVPLGDARHLAVQARVRERVVEVPGHPVEHV